MSDSIFTKIINRDIPASIIYEDEDLIVFLDINPIRKGHMLVVPKKHYQWIYQVPADLSAKLMHRAQLLMIHMKEKLDAHHIQLMVEGIDVPHTHIHLIPRFEDDGLEKRSHQKYDDGEINEYQSLLCV